jgi:hypothetical protein
MTKNIWCDCHDKFAPFFGKKIELNAETPLGLFAGQGRNRYIIVDNDNCKSAIVLNHADIPSFVCIELDDSTIDKGRPLGRWRLRFTSIWEEEMSPDPSELEDVGILCIGHGKAVLHCRDLPGDVRWIPLGAVDQRTWETRDYDGWALEALDSHLTFYEKWPTSPISIGYVSELS